MDLTCFDEGMLFEKGLSFAINHSRMGSDNGLTSFFTNVALDTLNRSANRCGLPDSAIKDLKGGLILAHNVIKQGNISRAGDILVSAHSRFTERSERYAHF